MTKNTELPEPKLTPCREPLCAGKGYYIPWGEDDRVECWKCKGTGNIETVWGFDIRDYDLSKILWGFSVSITDIGKLKRYVYDDNLGDYWANNFNQNIKGPGFILNEEYSYMTCGHEDKETVKAWRNALIQYRTMLNKAFS